MPPYQLNRSINSIRAIRTIYICFLGYSTKRYQDGANEQKEMFYDKNGALIADFDRKICAIRNNIFSLPDTIQFANGNQIINSYDAMGKMIKIGTIFVGHQINVANLHPGTYVLRLFNGDSFEHIKFLKE